MQRGWQQRVLAAERGRGRKRNRRCKKRRVDALYRKRRD